MNKINMDIESILALIEQNPNISDLHISWSEVISYRLNGDIIKEDEAGVISNENVELFLKQLFQGNPQRFNKFLGDKECDFAYISRTWNPYRVNAFLSTGKIGIVMRKINKQPKKLEDLMFTNIADSIKKNVLVKDKGLFFVTGPTGAGKTTSIIAMLNEINNVRSDNIITIEDPIEYVFKQEKCLISQREVGHDTWSYKNALKSAMREDPDIIFVGEIRDTETAEAVLNMAETGHLVFSTLHTGSASQTISRFLSFFTPEMQWSIAERLSDILVGSLSQVLVKNKSESTRVGIFELMLNTTAIKTNIKKREFDQISVVLNSPSSPGMISWSKYAENLINKSIIDQKSLPDDLFNQKKII